MTILAAEDQLAEPKTKPDRITLEFYGDFETYGLKAVIEAGEVTLSTPGETEAHVSGSTLAFIASLAQFTPDGVEL